MKLMVVRQCCTVGNCGTCIGEKNHVYGKTVKVVQFIGRDREMLQKVAHNWREYKAEIVEVTEENLASLTPSSREYVGRYKIS